MNPFGKNPRTILTTVRRAMLFSVGSVLILQEKTEAFVKQAIERGEETQDEGKKLVQEMREKRKKRAPKRISALEVRVNHALKRHNAPTQEDIDALKQHITELTKRIDELASAK